MLKRRERSDAQPRWKNGHPAPKTTRLASASWIPFDSCPPTGKRPPNRSSPMASATTGTAPAAASQARRRMSIASWLGPASADTSSGSSAMPQIGHAPGWSWRTSGSIGQMKTVPGGAGGSARGAGDRYLAGSAANLVRHPAEQKW